MSETAQPPANTGVEGSHVVYAGRFADRIEASDLPDGYSILSEWDVLPPRLTAVADRAAILVILDPFSFPFETVFRERWDVPLIVILPTEFDAGFLVSVFGSALFEHLVFFDRVVTRDSVVWEHLRRRYGWAEGQRIETESEDLGGVVAEIHALLERESASPTNAVGDRYEAARYWSERGDALAASAPYRAICSAHHGPRFNKAMHRAQAAVIEPQFVVAREDGDESVPFEVLEVGVGVGRWASSFDLARTRFAGLDISEGMVRAARANFPEGRFDRLDPDLPFPHDDESFDLTFSVTVMHHNPTPAKRTLLSEMWRVTRPGGRLLFLEDFVVGRQSEKSTVYSMSVLRFMDLLLAATSGQVVLEHVESLRYPHDDMFRGGLISLSKLGVPKTW